MKYLTRLAHPQDKPISTQISQIVANATYSCYGPGTQIFYPDGDGYVKVETWNFGAITINNTNGIKVKDGQPFIWYNENYTDYLRSSVAGTYRRYMDGNYYAT